MLVTAAYSFAGTIAAIPVMSGCIIAKWPCRTPGGSWVSSVWV